VYGIINLQKNGIKYLEIFRIGNAFNCIKFPIFSLLFSLSFLGYIIGVATGVSIGVDLKEYFSTPLKID
jgi:hypothetical protein